MEVNEQNEDEMILVVIGDDDGTNKYETFDIEPEMPIPAKIEPKEDINDYSTEEDAQEIFKLEEFIEVTPDIEVLDEEYLSQEEEVFFQTQYIIKDIESQEEEEFSQAQYTKAIETYVSQKNRTPRKINHKTYISQKKRTPRKIYHKYVVDEADILQPKTKKRKKNGPQKLKPKPKRSCKKKQKVQIKKEPPSISDEDVFFEIEFLEDDAVVSPKNTLEDAQIEIIHNPPKKKIKKTIPRKNHVMIKKENVQDFIEDDCIEDYTEVEYLENPPMKNKVSKNNHVIKAEEEEFIPEKEEYVPEEEEYTPEEEEYVPGEEEYIPKEEEELDDDFTEDDYVPPKRRKNAKNPSGRSSRRSLKHTKKPKRPIKSFIAELMKNQPVYKQDMEKLVNYLVEYMRKRRPPSPPPNYCYLSDMNRYSCSLCDIEKPTESAASRHYQAAHGPRYLVCLACGSGFRSTVILYKHEKRCIAPDADIQLRARGVFLGRKGRGRPYLTENKFVPKEPPPGQPPKRIHIPHSQKKKYYCEKCPSYFTKEYLLEEHMHKHTGYRAFQCPDCPAAYVSRYQLNKHSKKHSNCEYICDHCGKVFKLKTTLTSHLDTHLPRPRFGCARCGRRYAKRAAVRLHIMLDHMQLPPPAVCPVCSKRYKRMAHVKIHMKKEHGLKLMTKRSIDRDLPYMKIEDLEGAKVVFNNDDGVEVVDITNKLNEQILP